MSPRRGSSSLLGACRWSSGGGSVRSRRRSLQLRHAFSGGRFADSSSQVIELAIFAPRCRNSPSAPSLLRRLPWWRMMETHRKRKSPGIAIPQTGWAVLPDGIEPSTRGFSIRYIYQLSYRANEEAK